MRNPNGPYAGIAQQVRRKREADMEQEQARRGQHLDPLRALSRDIKALAKRTIEVPGCHRSWGHLVDAADLLDQRIAELERTHGPAQPC